MEAVGSGGPQYKELVERAGISVVNRCNIEPGKKTPGTYAATNEKVADLLKDCTSTEMQDLLRIPDNVIRDHAKTLLLNIIAFFESEEGKSYLWSGKNSENKQQKEQYKRKRERGINLALSNLSNVFQRQKQIRTPYL